MSPRKMLRYQSKSQKSKLEYEALFTAILFQMDRGVDKSELVRRLVTNLDLDLSFFATGAGLTGKVLERMIADRIGRKLTEPEKEKLDTLLTAGQMRFSGGALHALKFGAKRGSSGGVIYKKAGDNPDAPDDPLHKPMDDNPRLPFDGLGGPFTK